MNCSEAKFHENYLTSDFHTNTVISTRVCLPIKMPSKTVIRSIPNQYLPHYKPFMRNIQPIYDTVQHISNDTTYILILNTFITLGVPYYDISLRVAIPTPSSRP